jgi:hypothetical protein
VLSQNSARVVQGRAVGALEVEGIRELMAVHPDWSRWRLSRALCEQWQWRNRAGQLKDMAARSLLLKLEERGLIELPARRRVTFRRMHPSLSRPPEMAWDQRPVAVGLKELGSLQIQEVSRQPAGRKILAAALREFHYLGFRGPVGQNLQYLVSDAQGRLLGCLLFGAAAWKCRARDEWIGWSASQRERHLERITNNTRFLILPWVQVPCLASWMLGRVLRRLPGDWQQKYGQQILLVETFVERERFRGTAYRAANWLRVGATTGRSRQDREHALAVPVKDVYVYLLGKKEGLCA